jgi:two-component system cell cycle response regulator DivK
MRIPTKDRRRSSSAVLVRAARADGPSILLVEDDADQRSLCSEYLRSCGFLPIACATLEEAFALAKRRTPDIVLLDRELPDGSGFDLARWLRQHPTYDDVRIVAFSGRNAPADVEEALRAGCDAFVAKPCSPRTLLVALQPFAPVVERASSVETRSVGRSTATRSAGRARLPRSAPRRRRLA